MVTPALLQQRQVRNYVKLRHLAALHGHGADARNAIQRRLQIVGRNLPKPRLRNRVGGEAVAENRKGGEGEPVGGDRAVGGSVCSTLLQRRIHQLQRAGTCPRSSRRRG